MRAKEIFITLFTIIAWLSDGQGNPYVKYVRMVERRSRRPIDSMDVSFYNVTGHGHFVFTGSCLTDANGLARVPDSFCFGHAPGKINGNKDRYWPSVDNVLPANNENAPIDTLTLLVDQLIIRPRKIENVYFAFDSYDVLDFYKEILDTLISTLKHNPSFKLEIQGHTDDKGSDRYNEILSEKRANSVKAYLVTKGISKDRISIEASGSAMPLAPNEKNGADDPEGRAQNRRVVFNLIREDPKDAPEIEYENGKPIVSPKR